MLKNRTLAILFFTLLVVNIGFGVIMPILPYYAENLGASATTLGLLSAEFATLVFIFAPIWGRLSDRHGRKPILLIGLAGYCLSFLVFGLSDRLWMLFVARAINGLLSSATLPTALGYIADSTNEEERSGGMSILGAAMGIGMVLGPAIGGFLGEISPNTPFFFSAGLALLVFIAGILYLPETLSAENRQAAAQRTGGPSRAAQLVQVVKGPLGVLMLVATFTSFGLSALEATAALFAERRFGAGEAEMGIMFMIMGLLMALAQFLLVGRVIRRLGEARAIQLSLAGTGIAFMLFGISNSIALGVVTIALLGVAMSFLRPAINALVSRRSPPEQQGAVLGVTNSFYSLGMMLGPVTGGLLFDHIGIAAPFFTAALIHAALLVVMMLVGLNGAGAAAGAPDPP
ncbi:MAG: MFS transporter [Anaerolineae bacterium]|nr:MFS transporter [Anaerolineae bacterium]